MIIKKLQNEIDERKLFSELILKYSQSLSIADDLEDNDFEIEILEEKIKELEIACIDDIAS